MERKNKKILINTVIILVLLAGFTWVVSRFVRLGRVEYTDNAQVRRLIVPVKIVFTDANRAADLQRLRSGLNVECETAY